MTDSNGIIDVKQDIVSIDQHQHSTQQAHLASIGISQPSRYVGGTSNTRVGSAQSNQHQNYSNHHPGHSQPQLFQSPTTQSYPTPAQLPSNEAQCQYPAGHRQNVAGHSGIPSPGLRGSSSLIYCPRCPQLSFWTDEDLKHHVSEEHDTAYTTGDSAVAQSCERIRHADQQICKICSKFYRPTSDAENGLAAMLFSCRQCHGIFHGKAAMEQHVRETHDSSRQFNACDHCALQCFSATSAASHNADNSAASHVGYAEPQPLPTATHTLGSGSAENLGSIVQTNSTVMSPTLLPQHQQQPRNNAHPYQYSTSVSGFVPSSSLPRDLYEDQSHQTTNTSSLGRPFNLPHITGNMTSFNCSSGAQTHRSTGNAPSQRNTGASTFANSPDLLYDDKCIFGSGIMTGGGVVPVPGGNTSGASKRCGSAGGGSANSVGSSGYHHALQIFNVDNQGGIGITPSSTFSRTGTSASEAAESHADGSSHQFVGSLVNANNSFARDDAGDGAVAISHPISSADRSGHLSRDGTIANQLGTFVNSNAPVASNSGPGASQHQDSACYSHQRSHVDFGNIYQVQPLARGDFLTQVSNSNVVAGHSEAHRVLDPREKRCSPTVNFELGSHQFGIHSRIGQNSGSLFDGKPIDDSRGELRGPFANVSGQVAKSIVCGQCQQTFGDHGSLQRHSARAHRTTGIKGPVICEQCNAELKNEQNLKRHIAVCHTGQQEHQCLHCNASFSSRGSLRIHQQQVHNIPAKIGRRVPDPSSGDIGTSASHQLLPRGSKSRSAKQGKASDKSWACDMCSDTFKWKGNLKRHRELRHLHLRPFVCHICHASFGTKSNMRVHLITHDKPDMY